MVVNIYRYAPTLKGIIVLVLNYKVNSTFQNNLLLRILKNLGKNKFLNKFSAIYLTREH